MKYLLQILKAKVKVSLNLPITRVDVLKLAKAEIKQNPEKYPGLCSLLSRARIRQACDAIYVIYEGNPLIEEDDILEPFEDIIIDYYKDLNPM